MTIPAGLISGAIAKAARARARRAANEAALQRLLRGTEAGAVANGMAVPRSGFSRILAAFDGDRWSAELDRAVAQEALRLRDIMTKSLVEQRGGLQKPFAPLSKATIALRRSKARKQAGGRAKGTKALIATGQLYQSIQVVARGNTRFIGIPRMAKRKGGGKTESMVNIALIQEHGFATTWTDKQSRWFWAQISQAHNAQANAILRSQRKRGKRKTSTVRMLIVPPRPFIGPSVETWRQGLGSRLEEQIKPRLVGGD